MNPIARYLVRYIFKILYGLGLAFIIIFLLTTEAPPELGLWHGTPTSSAFIAIFLIVAGIVGVYHTCQKQWPKTLRSLGLWTLIPGVLALAISVYGFNILYSYLEKSLVTNFELLKPIIDSYIQRRIPTLWILTISYILIGLFLYIFGIKKRTF